MEIRKVKKKQMKIRRAKEQSIKVKTESIKLAGAQGAKYATREIDGGQEVLDAAMNDILAVYMVKHGMGEVATIINDTTKGWIETVVDDMCDYTLSDSTEVTVNEDGTEVSQTVLYINVKLKSYEDMISVYGLNEEKVKIARQIKNDLMSN